MKNDIAMTAYNGRQITFGELIDAFNHLTKMGPIVKSNSGFPRTETLNPNQSKYLKGRFGT